MAKFANITSYGVVTGFYDTALAPAPAGAIALTDDQYAQWVQNPPGFVWQASSSSLIPAPAPPAPTPVIPQQITIYQAKAQLFGMPGATSGKTMLDDVGAWAAAQGGLTLLAWNEASMVTRSGAFVGAAATQFGWTAAQLDEMFTAAAAIKA